MFYTEIGVLRRGLKSFQLEMLMTDNYLSPNLPIVLAEASWAKVFENY